MHHLDAVFFHPGGAPADRGSAIDETARLAEGAAWVIEGNHGAALKAVAARAERVVILRLGRWSSLRRIVRRRVPTPGELRDRGPGGGPQVRPWHLVRYALLVHPRIEAGHVALIHDAATGPVETFDRPHDAAAWLGP